MISDASTPTALRQSFLNLRKARRLARERFLAGRKAERYYQRQLAQVARQIRHIVRGMAPEGVVTDIGALTSTLNRYADILTPWGESVVSRMVADVSRRDATAWEQHAREIGQTLRREIASAPTGAAMRQALQDRVQEITSLPRKAAERLFKLTTEAVTTSTRAKEIQQEILASGRVSLATAKMLARTGVSTTATVITKARAEHIGSPGYIWRTSKDGAVRPSHRKMEGKLVPWGKPPTLDNYTAHCGEFANCRCFPEPIIPDRFGTN
jgi:SPP1 gp7 family putative phage head morphogenesis protein